MPTVRPTYEPLDGAPDPVPPPCDDPERRRAHPIGTDGSCHTCAMALREDYTLDPEAVFQLGIRDARRRLDAEETGC